MPNEKELEKQVKEYAQLAKEDKNIDVAALMINALQNQSKESISAKSRRWPYLISAGAPPFGLFFVVKYYFSDEDGDRQAALICLLLTIASLLSFWWIGKIIFGSSGTTPSQILQIKPQDVMELTK